MNWDDLRIFLAVARMGSLHGAARNLGVNHSTVFRRIASFEEQLGTRLFNRSPTGYTLTLPGKRVLRAAERMEAEALEVSQEIEGQDQRLSGLIRVTMSEVLTQYLLMPRIAEFQRAYPDIKLEINSDELNLDIARGESDIAFRVSNAPPNTLFGRRISDIRFAIYGSRDYLARCQPNLTLPEHDWIETPRDRTPNASNQWMESFAPNARVVCQVGTGLSKLAALKNGLGLTSLPCFLCDPDPTLVRINTDIPPPDNMGLWLLTRDELRKTLRMRVFMEKMGKAIESERANLEGTSTDTAASEFLIQQ